MSAEESILTFFQSVDVTFLPHVQFESDKTRQRIEAACAKEARKHNMDPRQKWLGSYYSKEIGDNFVPDVTIVWIDPTFGYGVFTNQNIPSRAYLGEYTGVVRKQRFFKKIKNDYCFDYTFVSGRDNSPYLIDAEKQGNHTRFINHSDEPNLETAAVFSDGLIHIILYAIRNISRGEQLCYDYGGNYWKKLRPSRLQRLNL